MKTLILLLIAAPLGAMPCQTGWWAGSVPVSERPPGPGWSPHTVGLEAVRTGPVEWSVLVEALTDWSYDVVRTQQYWAYSPLYESLDNAVDRVVLWDQWAAQQDRWLTEGRIQAQWTFWILRPGDACPVPEPGSGLLLAGGLLLLLASRRIKVSHVTQNNSSTYKV